MNTHAVLLIAVSALVTALIRFAPFLVFRGGSGSFCRARS